MLENKTNENQSNENDQPTQPKEESYSKDFVQKLMNEKKNWSLKAQELEKQVKLQEEEKLLKEKRFEELALQREKELNEWRSKHTQLESKIIENSKTSELKKELIKLGIDTKYIDDTIKLADTSRISYDADSGIITGAELVAKTIHEKFQPLFNSKGQAGNHQAPSVQSQQPITLDDYKKLNPEEKKKYSNDLYKNLGIIRTS